MVEPFQHRGLTLPIPAEARPGLDVNRIIALLFLTLVVLRPHATAQQPTPTPDPQQQQSVAAAPPLTTNEEGGPTISEDDTITVPPGELPDFDTLRFRHGKELELQAHYLESLSTTSEDLITSSIIFPEVAKGSKFAELHLGDLIALALENNFELANARRSVLIARSSTRGEEATFIPFVDLVGESRYIFDRNENATRVETSKKTGLPRTVPTTRDTDTWRNSPGVESGVTLPTGAQITANGRQTRDDTSVSDGAGTLPNERSYSSNAEIRLLQPLLRGAGPDVAQAGLRRARIREMDQVLSEQINRRDITFDVINGYFGLLQTARQLQVSADAIRIRQQFLDETRIKFDVGRVDESEILRAEIQYLSELETAVDRRRALLDQKDSLLITLGLPLDTPISFVDITESLAKRGRVNIPGVQDAIDEGLNSRMELMRQDLSVALGEIDQRVARNDLLPDLNLDGGYNRNDSGRSYSEGSGFENSGWDAGVSFRIPLINIQRRESAKRTALNLEQKRTDRLSVERSTTQQILSFHRSVLSTEAQLTLLSKNVEQARKNLDLINGQFEVGFSTVTEVRLAQDDLFAAETRYSNTLLNYQIQLARLYVALGRPLI
ncbi:hypothetical protein BH09SUM1_BH09SUM1_30490 [soil metagenome]